MTPRLIRAQTVTNYYEQRYLLANCRSCSDMAGNFTCCQYNGRSVVDVLIVQRDIMPLNFDWYSDHGVISASLAVIVNTAVPLSRAAW